MKVSVNKDDLTFATQTVIRILTSKTGGASAGIRLTAEDGKLTLTANDLEIAMACQINAEVITAGAIVIPGKLLGEAVRRFPGQEVDLSVQEGRQVLSLRSGFSELDLIGMASTYFPELPDIVDFSRLTISQPLLKSMLKQVSFAISTDDMRPILTGMLCECRDNSLRMVAADGFRVASRKEDIGSECSDGFRVVVPGRAVHEIARLLTDYDGSAEVAVGRNHILVKINDTTIISKLLEGNYLNVDQYLPTKFTTQVEVKPKALLDALERASVVAKDGLAGTVRLHFSDSLLKIRAQSAEYGTHFEEWAVDMNGDSLEILFNIRVLSDVLKSVETGDIKLSFTGTLGPCVGRNAAQDENYWSLAMPVRLS
ncbi:MAG: DNA polymerase III subunit beta [Bacillota bacterium]|nr:DNA polymerase III subunit beta [Bacillota bacterium]